MNLSMLSLEIFVVLMNQSCKHPIAVSSLHLLPAKQQNNSNLFRLSNFSTSSSALHEEGEQEEENEKEEDKRQYLVVVDGVVP
eukprot:CAMPEP_0201539354 /NCGR_PEP_ID=MMETSP0161_2-20130828/70144_1 /ASSEMBLY_ACC=CAM_ASM_000251 /TAXON_ID=180227 /ORGANISM="Neoparamoeba aestuarina, Strain SoJaBio B1-5/56/2" /LENGTH=82 /DNA_ID=CAMNT_0047946683 /DNA_START=402 /DNA_END=646 /DNA_ORIENTATION=+